MITTRIPYDVTSQAAQNAERRGWSMSQYVAWCVERAVAYERKEKVSVGHED